MPSKDGSPLHRRVLYPVLILRIALFSIYLVYYILAIAFITSHDRAYLTLWSRYGHTAAFRLIITFVAVMVVTLLCLILDLVCLIKRALGSLTPRFFLIVEVAQTTIWTVLYVIAMIGPKNMVQVIANSVFYGSFVGVLVYAGVMFHKQRMVAKYNRVSYQAPEVTAESYEPYGRQVPEVTMPPAAGRYEPYSSQPAEWQRKPVPSQSERLVGNDGRYA
ncbi:hypothetical protein CC79DRAFT_1395414 [Sarocladium strictum]